MSSSNLDKFKQYISSLLSTSSVDFPNCNYYTENEFNTSFQSLGNASCNLNIFRINIHSLNANHSKLFQLMMTLNANFDVIVLSENDGQPIYLYIITFSLILIFTMFCQQTHILEVLELMLTNLLMLLKDMILT